MPQARDHFFDNAKFFLILLVVIGHSMELVMTPYLRVAYKLIYLFHMQAFTLVSGYFFRKQGAENAYKTIMKLSLQYLVFQLAFQLFSIHVLGSENSISFTTPYWLLWFHLALIAWRIITPYILKVPHIKVPHILALSFFAAILAGYDRSIGYYMSISRIIVLYPCGVFL